MRVIVAQKFWYRRAGAENVMFDEIAQLEARGHDIAGFSTAHPENDASPWSDYFVPYLELGAKGRLSPKDKAVALARMFSNVEAARRFERLILDFRPDLVHAHNINRQLSPSILVVAKRLGVPVVHTLHDMHKLCPCDIGLRAGVEPCVPRLCGRYWYGPAVTHRCQRGKLSVSALSAAELGFQRMRHVYERTVARFVSPSRFLADLMREGGFANVPIDVILNACDVGETAEQEDFFFFAGRLTPGKGVEVFLEAAERAGVHAVVAGDGPSAAEFRRLYPHVDYRGWVSPQEVGRLRARALAAVVPSLCLEAGPLSAIESLAVGVPVIGTDLASIPEIVRDGVTGRLVPPGDVAALEAALRSIAADREGARRMGIAGRERVRADFGMERHIDALLETYERALRMS